MRRGLCRRARVLAAPFSAHVCSSRKVECVRVCVLMCVLGVTVIGAYCLGPGLYRSLVFLFCMSVCVHGRACAARAGGCVGCSSSNAGFLCGAAIPWRCGKHPTAPYLLFFTYRALMAKACVGCMCFSFLTPCSAGEASSGASPGRWGAGLFLAPSLVLAWLGAPILYRLQCPPRADLVHACFSPARTKTCSLRLFMTGVSSCASGVLVSRSDPAVNSHELRFTLWL